MKRPLVALAPGPFTADQIRSGDPYELSNGHALFSPPAGQRHARSSLVGGAVLESDPKVESAGVDPGVSPAPGVLRAPDVGVGKLADAPGWAKEGPPLAVEYADTGQDERELALKIEELFAAGTKHIWVVRLTPPRRVEVHEPGRPVRVARPGQLLRAPSVLANPVRVEALWDAEVAHEAVLANLLQRKGYESLDSVRTEGRIEGRAEGHAEGHAQGLAEGEAAGVRRALLTVLSARRLIPTKRQRATIVACDDPKRLRVWLRRAATAASVRAVLARTTTRA